MKSKTLKPTDDAGTAETERLRRSERERLRRSSTASSANAPPPKPISNRNAKEVSEATEVSVTSTSKIPASIKIKTTIAEMGKGKDHNENKESEEAQERSKEEKNKKEKEKEEEKEKETENVIEEKSTTTDSSNSSSEDSSTDDDEEEKDDKEEAGKDDEEKEEEAENEGTQTTISTLTRNTTTTDTATKPTIEDDPILEFDGKEDGNEDDPIEMDLDSGQKEKGIDEEDPISQFEDNTVTPTKHGTNIIPISGSKDYSKGNGRRSKKGLKEFEYVDYNNTISTWTPLTQKEWSTWDLEHPPGENHKFWTQKAPIILHALEFWILNNVRIDVPYMWHEEYKCHRNKPPKRPDHDSSLLAVRMPTIYDLYNNVKNKVEKNYGSYSQYSSEKFASEIKYHPKMEELKQKMTKENKLLTTAKKRFAIIRTAYKKLTIDSIATDQGITLSRMFSGEKTKIENCIKKNEAFKKQFSQLQKRLSEHVNEKVSLEKMDKSEFTEEEIESMKSAFTDASWAETYDENLLYNGGSTDSSTVGGTQTSHSSTANSPSTLPGQNKNTAQVAAHNAVDVTDTAIFQKESAATSQKDPSVSLLDDNRLPPERKVEFSLSKQLRDKLLDKKLTKFNWKKLENQNIDQHLSYMKFEPSVIASLNLDIRKEILLSSERLIENELKRWNKGCTNDIFEAEGTYMKFLREPPNIVCKIDDFKDSHVVTTLQTALENDFNDYRKKAQATMNNYTRAEAEYWKTKRFQTFQVETIGIIRLVVNETMIKSKWRNKINKILGKNFSPQEIKSVDNMTGWIYALTLVGDACTSILDWSDLRNTEEMFEKLTTNLKFPPRVTEQSYQAGTGMKIGTIILQSPNQHEWSVATTISNILSPIIGELSLGMKTKLYNCIINFKAAESTRTMQVTRSTVHITEKMYDILQRTDVDERLKAGKMVKTVFDAVLTHTMKSRKRLNASITESNSTKKSKTSSTKTKKQKTDTSATSATYISEKVKINDSSDSNQTTTNTPKSTTNTTTNTPKSALRNSNKNKDNKDKNKDDDNGDNRQNKHPKFTPPPPTGHHQQKDERIPIGHTYAGSNFNPAFRKTHYNPYDKQQYPRYNNNNNNHSPNRHNSPRRRSSHHHRQYSRGRSRSRSRSPIRENRYSSSSSSSKKYRRR